MPAVPMRMIGPRQYELALLDPFEALQLRRDLLNLHRSASQHDDFQAQIVIQMDMRRGDDEVGMPMLDFQHLFDKLLTMMVEDKGQRAGRVGSVLGPTHVGQLLVKKLADRFASGGNFAFLTKSIEAFEKVRFQRD